MNINWLGVSWLAAERIVAAVAGLITTFLIARFMGPEDFGTFSYLFAFVGIGLATGQLGMDSLLVRSFVKADQSDATVIGTAVLIKCGANILAFSVVVLVLWLSNPGGKTEMQIILLSSAIFLLSSVTTVIGPWFKAREKFKSLLYVRVVATVISLTVKVLVIASDLPLLAMAAAHILYFVVEAYVITRFFIRAGGAPLTSWAFEINVAKDLALRGGPLFIGTIIATTYMNVDLIMLRYFWDARTVGEYALIPQLLGAVQIIPYAITSSVFPRIVSLIERDDMHGASQFCFRVYSRLFVFSLGVIVLIIFLVRPLVPFIFGAEYEPSLSPMLIAAFAVPFIFFRHLSTKLFVAHDIRFSFVKIELAGLMVNLVLNVLLIPLYAGSGAALATVMAFFASTIIMPILVVQGRSVFLPIIRHRKHGRHDGF